MSKLDDENRSWLDRQDARPPFGLEATMDAMRIGIVDDDAIEDVAPAPVPHSRHVARSAVIREADPTMGYRIRVLLIVGLLTLFVIGGGIALIIKAAS